jgi:alkyl hydroperoxide reductase subunit AhpC
MFWTSDSFGIQKQKENVAVQVVSIYSNFNSTKVTENDIKSIFAVGELPFPIFLDEGHLVNNQFDSEGTPQWLLTTKDGIVSRSIFGSQEGHKSDCSMHLQLD